MTTDGGQAFPCDRAYESQGASLRDYFAAHAHQALILESSGEDWINTAPNADELRVLAEYQAMYRYILADAMLAERAKKQK